MTAQNASRDNGNGRVTQALLQQSFEHLEQQVIAGNAALLERIEDSEDNADRRLKEYMEFAETRRNDYIKMNDDRAKDHEDRLRTVHDCTTVLNTKIDRGYLATGGAFLTALGSILLKMIGGSA
jgi:hypothetical protein